MTKADKIKDEDIIASFTEAARKGQVVTVQKKRGLGLIQLAPVKLPRDWAIPCFNFGHLDDARPDGQRNHPEAWSKIEWDALWGQAKEKVSDGTFALPFPRCFYAFHFGESSDRYECIDLLHLNTQEGCIVGHCFYWSPGAPGALSRWQMCPWSFVISVADHTLDYAVDPGADLSPHDVAEYEADCRGAYTKVMDATMFLKASNHFRQPASQAHHAANRGRALGKLEPLPEILNVSLHRSYSRAAPVGASEFTRAPHERRGHYRTLASGREVFVKAASIHGGDPAARLRMVSR